MRLRRKHKDRSVFTRINQLSASETLFPSTPVTMIIFGARRPTVGTAGCLQLWQRALTLETLPSFESHIKDSAA